MNRQQRIAAMKVRECQYCGANSGAASFCGVCYGLMPGDVKIRIRAAYKFGSPSRVRTIASECLDGLRAAGVPVREKRRRKEAA